MSAKIRLLAFVLFALALSTTGFAQYSQPVRDVENPARTPIWGYSASTISVGYVNTLIDLTTVPVGQRMVIEHVGVTCTTDGDDNISRATVWIFKKNVAGYSSYGMPLVVTKQGNTYDGKASWAVSQSLRIYSDGVGNTTTVDVRHSKITANASCYAVLSGYTLATP